MKKMPYLISGLLSLLACSAQAADSTINISGNVRDNTCFVGKESKDFTVKMGNYSDKDFYPVGATTRPIPFSIVLSPCGASVTAVKIGFTGTADSRNTSLLGLSGSASGFGLQLLNDRRKGLTLNAPLSAMTWITLKPGQSNTLNFYARLVTTRSPVTVGPFSGTANFTLEFQ